MTRPDDGACSRKDSSRSVVMPEARDASPDTRCIVSGCNAWADPLLPIAICSMHAYAVAETFITIRLGDMPSGKRAVNKDRARKSGGWVYFLRIGDRIKIGHTTNLRSRLAAYPPDTTVLAVCPGSREDEAALHQLFQSYREGGREWYGGNHAPILQHIADVLRDFGPVEDHTELPKRTRMPSAQHVSMRSRSGGRYTRR